MKKQDTFSGYHPLINFAFFIGAIVCGMVLMHPLFLSCSLVLSSLYYMTIRGRDGAKFLLRMFGMFVLLSGINPFFNGYGGTVLFTYLGGRIYTLEALYYGMALAAMAVSVLIWFSCYNTVMTSDKFLYLFGRMIPSISLILTMVLRLVPDYQKKISQVSGARKCVGKSVDTGSRKERVTDGMTILSALTSWALEGAIITADSMRSRGYGCGKRTSFSLYRFDTRDRVLCIIMLVLLGIVVLCGARGGAAASYTPGFFAAAITNGWTAAGAAAYFLFLAIPAAVNIMEDMIWHILRSGI